MELAIFIVDYQGNAISKTELLTFTRATKSSFSQSGRKITFSSLDELALFSLRIDAIKGEQAPKTAA